MKKMKNMILARKLGMSQIIRDNGKVVPVTLLKVLDLEVLDVSDRSEEGTSRVTLGAISSNEDSLSKPVQGQFKKYGKGFYRFLLEREASPCEEGSFSLEGFSEEDVVSVRGKSKGKGFQGTIKRHGFSRGPMTHGSKNHRRPGSIGGGTDPARVFKGTRMGGRMGGCFRTIKNLVVEKIDKDASVIYIKGAIPGASGQRNGSLIEVYKV